MATRNKLEREEARKRLLSSIKPGDTLFTVLRHVSSSGMSRDIDIYQIESTIAEPNVWWLSGLAAAAAGFSRKGDAIRVSGAGMDMGYHLVYSLSRCLFPEGFGCIGETCPSNDHSNGDAYHWHKDGGYALRHRWI